MSKVMNTFAMCRTYFGFGGYARPSPFAYRSHGMKSELGTAWLWVERTTKFLGMGILLALTTAFLVWVLMVDWQVLGG